MTYKMSVRCGKTTRGQSYPSVPNYETIPAWSRGKAPWKTLSPFYLGPVIVDDDDLKTLEASNMENAWQSGKIYTVDLISLSKPITVDNLKDSFWDRRVRVAQSSTAIRRPLPKAQYGLPIAAYYNGEIMNYIQSRKEIYCPTYAALAQESSAYKLLKAKYDAGEKLLIVGPDGYDANIKLSKEKLLSLVHNEHIIFGHELVLCALLMDCPVWEEDFSQG